MAKYKVIVPFRDLQDNNHIYYQGDTFPREGVDVSDERIEELASKNNKRNEVLIKEVEEQEDYPKHTGGGYYELSSGEKVKGKDAAIEAEKALKSGE